LFTSTKFASQLLFSCEERALAKVAIRSDGTSLVHSLPL
jgi:hypothetical protein